MNDKIRELLVESGFCFWTGEEWGPGAGKGKCEQPVDWGSNYDKELDRFVELLVRECAVIAANAEGICGVTAEAITTHFGIEDEAEAEEKLKNWRKEMTDLMSKIK